MAPIAPKPNPTEVFRVDAALPEAEAEAEEEAAEAEAAAREPVALSTAAEVDG